MGSAVTPPAASQTLLQVEAPQLARLPPDDKHLVLLTAVPALYRTLLFTHSVHTSLHLLIPNSQPFIQFLAQRKCSQMSAVVPVRQETEEPCAEEAAGHFPLTTVSSRVF